MKKTFISHIFPLSLNIHTMQAILLKSFGDPNQLYIGETTTPTPQANQILVKIHATALNRADTLQRRGLYPPPAGESDILGLEMAGEVVALGSQASKWKIGDRVCSLLGSGGYAENVCIHEDMALPIPAEFSYEEAAALPEVFLTAYQAIVYLGRLQKEERILVHAGASGVGTAAIQLGKAIGAEVIVTASAPKHDICLSLGASHAIDYKSENFAKAIKEYKNGEGVDLVIDFVGAPYFHDNLEVLRMDGRMVILAFLGGAKVDTLDIRQLQRKRLNIMGSTLRARSLDYKIQLTKDLKDFAWPLFESGALKPIVDSVFSWTEVADAHRYMEANKNIGKIVLKIA